MTELTHEQANSMLAEMMGDELTQFGASCSIDLESGEMEHKPAYFDKDDKLFTPTTNTDHALQALEAWLKKNSEMSSRIDSDDWGHIVKLEKDTPVNTRVLGFAHSKELSMAICQALCSAISKEPVTIKEV